MPRPSLVRPKDREAVLDAWAAGAMAPQIARVVGLPAQTVHGIVTTARRQGDGRAVLRNAGAARRPEPVTYRSSRSFLDAALARRRERQEARALDTMHEDDGHAQG